MRLWVTASNSATDAFCIRMRWCTGPSKIGRDNVFHPFCAIGGDPQDLKFHGEHVELIVGDGNTFANM